MQDPKSILKQYWGYDSFRGIQEAVITSVMSGSDTLALMPTGGGKSLCFQVPALAMDGLCLVVSPLIALMKDQVKNLTDRGIKAAAIYSGMPYEQILTTMDNCILGDFKLLYVSPERLSTDIFRAKLQRVRRISLIAVDEAHCISQWGYDFRPSYMQIAALRQQVGAGTPVLALTATATPEVVDDIQNRLGFSQKNVLSMSFERRNLTYVVRKVENKMQEAMHILSSIPQGSAIIYVRNRKDTMEVSEFLTQNGLPSLAYNAGMSSEERNKRQEAWTSGKVRIMVATNAFGMGIDKPDVRLVIHLSSPNSLEAYFQEAGRAGRDGLRSYSVILYNSRDIRLLRQETARTYPEQEHIRKIYEDLCYFLQVGVGESQDRTYLFDIGTFCRTFHHFSIETDAALKILNSAGYIEYHEMEDIQSRVLFTLKKSELYRLGTNDPETETVMTCLLRMYPGIFAEYKYIDEHDLAIMTGYTPVQIYGILKSLAQRNIISFIPHRNVPTVTFTRRRVETEQIFLPDDAYMNRKTEMTKRIEYIINYLTDTEHCRSVLLLNYFGEQTSRNCGTCDRCVSQ